MKFYYPYLKDQDFLNKINNQHLKEVFVKISLLDWNENFIQEIQGLATSGSLNLDGKSSVRRTGTLTMLIDENTSKVTNINNLFSINKKVFLEVGYKNNTSDYTDYDILWFPQGTYVLSSCSLSHNSSNNTLTLQLRDKMCLLNGDCGGVLPASVEFDKYETTNNYGEYITEKPLISEIIRELVHHYGKEQVGKIIISDIPSMAKQIMRWNGTYPLYSYWDGSQYRLTLNAEGKTIYKTFTKGDDVCYVYTDFTYPSELVSSAGETITSILDKIVNTLGGNYEYFYDISGNFIFQEIKNYLNTTQATTELTNLNNENYKIDITKNKIQYSFNDSNLIISYSNNPQFLNVKNDFVVWGTRQNSSGLDLPIRYHLAIDTKPKTGNLYNVIVYEDEEDGLQKAISPIRCASRAQLPNPGIEGYLYIIWTSTTTYEIYKWENKMWVQKKDLELTTLRTNDWRTELYLQGVCAEPLGLEQNYYYAELKNEWPKLYDIKKTLVDGAWEGGFHDGINNKSTDIDFFLDFIDGGSAIGEFNVDNIGRRSKVEDKDDYNCIFESELLDLVIINEEDDEASKIEKYCKQKGQKYIKVDNDFYSLLSTGGSLNSCFEEIKTLLWTYTNYNESISMQMLPMYYLEPNVRIEVKDAKSDINGDYLINSISIPLTYNGTMTLNASRIINKI